MFRFIRSLFSRSKKPQVPRSSTIITIPGDKVRVTLCEARYFTEKEMAKLQEAMCVLSYVLNSDTFKMAMNFNERDYPRTFTGTKMTGAEVYNVLMSSSEALSGVQGTFGYDHSDEDHEIDLSLEAYHSRWSRVVGYTMPRQLTIWLNRKFFLAMKPWGIAGNLCHEHLHKLGFDHESASDHASVPYAVGHLVEELGEKHYTQAMKLKPQIETIIYARSLL